MIKNIEPISLVEVLEYIKKDEAEKVELKGFIKKFASLNAKNALELKKKLVSLDLMKLKNENIAKIIELFPEDAEDLNKIFTDVSLDEDETKKILDAIKQFK